MSHIVSFWPLLVILIILGLIIILINVNIRFTIIFNQINSHSRIRVGAQALNKIVNIGLKTFYQTGNKPNADLLVNSQEDSNPIFSMPTITEAFNLLHRFKMKHLGKMSCEKLKWESQIGVNDPMGSAMLCGSLWGIKYYLIGLLSGKWKYNQNPEVKVQPLYNHTHFNTELYCEIKLKLRQAIWLSVAIVWHVSKTRREKKKLENLTTKYS